MNDRRALDAPSLPARLAPAGGRAELPSEEARRLIALAAEARDKGPARGELADVIAWARAFTPAPLAECACGKLTHTTHRGAAQHAAWEILFGDSGSPRWKVYPCRRFPRRLHVGR